MDNPNDPLDRLISETLKSIHGHALQDGLANSYRTLDTAEIQKATITRRMHSSRLRSNSLFAVAASIALIIGIGIPVLNSTQGSDNSKQVRSASKVATTTSTNPESEKENRGTTTSTAPNDDGENVTTTTTKSSSQNTTPFFTSPPISTTTPAVVDEYVRVSYSNTRANDFALDGATISGNVYIFIPDLDTYGAIWWLDQPGVWDKNLKTRSGTKKPIDFNYRVQPEAIVPNPYDTSALAVGEHTMGIETHSISTDKYTRRTIKFYVSR